MPTVSQPPSPRARKNEAIILHHIARVGLEPIAQELGVDDSTVSRMKSEGIPRLARLLACCGLKVVREEYQCWPEDQIEAMRVLANAYMQRTRHASDLAWEDPE